MPISDDIEFLLSRCEVPSHYRDVYCTGVGETVATRAVKKWLDDGPPILFLHGGVGSGKTVGAVGALLRADLKENWPGVPVNGWFVRASTYAQKAFGEAGRRYVEDAAEVSWLVLDDLGLEYLDDKGYARGVMESLLEARHSGSGRTVITSNLAPKGIRARYGDRVADRLIEAAMVCHCGDVSMRVPRETMTGTA